MMACHSQSDRTSVNILLLVNTPVNRFLFCLNKTALPIAQNQLFRYDHDFTTEAVVLGNRRLIGRAVIIITERTGSS